MQGTLTEVARTCALGLHRIPFHHSPFSPPGSRYEAHHPRRLRHGPRSFQHPAFQRLMFIGLTSYLSRFTDFTIIAWLVVQETDSPLAVGALLFFRFISFLLLGPFVGTIADRFPRIRMVRASQFGISIFFFMMAGLLFMGSLELWHIYVYTFCNGLLFLFDIPARRTYMATVVGSQNLTAAIALDMITSNLAWFVGSNVAGVLLAQSRPEYVYTALGVIGLSNILVIRTLPILWRASDSSGREPFLSSMRAGARFSWEHKAILGVLMAVGITNMTGFPFESMAPVFARELFDAGPLLFGMLLSAQGLGSLAIAAWLVSRGRRFRRPGLLVVGSSIVLHLGSIGLTFLSHAAAGLATLFALGGVAMVFSIMHNSFFLFATPDSMRGRVMGIQLLVIGLYPIGTLTLGLLANELGAAQATRLVALVGLGLMVGVFLLFRDLRYPARQLGIETGLAAAVGSRAEELAAMSIPPEVVVEVEEKVG